MSAEVLTALAVFAAIAASFFVSASAGLGGSLVLIPTMTLILGTKQGVAMAALLLAGNNVIKVAAYRRVVPLKASLLVAGMTIVGAFLGARLLVSIPDRIVGVAVVLAFGVAVSAEEKLVWPSLDDVDAVSGRAATKTDVEEGRAVFLLQSDDVSKGTPLEIAIPQYAYHIQAETNERTPVVIIQAEEFQDNQIVGALSIESGEFIAALLWEFELLGSVAPE